MAVSIHPYRSYSESTSPAPFNSHTYQVAQESPDVVLVTSNFTRFYAHSRRLHHASENAWGGTLARDPPPVIISVPEDACTLRVLLHAVYGLSCVHLTPSLETVSLALAALIKYGVAAYRLAEPRMPLYQLVLALAPAHPLETYALAGQYHLEAVAVAASAHLCACDTATLEDALIRRMGAGYFERLLARDDMRRAALKAIVLRPPRMHAPTRTCGEQQQRAWQKAWAFAAAELGWDAVPGLSGLALQSALLKATTDRLTCEGCRSAFEQRIQEVTTAWSAVLKRTI